MAANEDKMKQKKQITISAFFCGSGPTADITDQNIIDPYLFNQVIEDDNHIKMGFDGAAMNRASDFIGFVFGLGWDKNCDEVISEVQKQIELGHKVKLNICGQSRGGVSAFLLAKQLQAIDPNYLEINLVVTDPVPGNLSITAKLDPFHISIANMATDLRDCRSLKNVLAIYSSDSGFPGAIFPPLVPLYPAGTIVETVIAPGDHGSMNSFKLTEKNMMFSCTGFIWFANVFKFLRENGTNFNFSQDLWVGSNWGAWSSEEDFFSKEFIGYSDNGKGGDNTEITTLTHQSIQPTISDAELDVEIVVAYNNVLENSERFLMNNSRTTINPDEVTFVTKQSELKTFYNQQHQLLSGNSLDDASVQISIEKKHDLFAVIKRASWNYPKIWQAFKWTVLGLGITAALFFTGGLVAIPLLQLIASPLILAPIVTLILPLIWYVLVKPPLKWAVMRLCFPKYSIRHFSPPIVSEQDSYDKMKPVLGKEARLLDEKYTLEESLNNLRSPSDSLSHQKPSESIEANYQSCETQPGSISAHLL